MRHLRGCVAAAISRTVAQTHNQSQTRPSEKLQQLFIACTRLCTHPLPLNSRASRRLGKPRKRTTHSIHTYTIHSAAACGRTRCAAASLPGHQPARRLAGACAQRCGRRLRARLRDAVRGDGGGGGGRGRGARLDAAAGEGSDGEARGVDSPARGGAGGGGAGR